ncbi:MAG: very large tegument protein [Myxococcaceae bacterium]|jgi:hypothetical protein|nr:very large tegument protein [Myxococcaceae bacterium]MEA2749402.1 hypothetical protein [Myxococcales bacterium]
MDCEKFEPLLLDELYEELDEVTSAAVKRHVSGCARCGPILEGMRSTRRLAGLPMLEVPDGLEDRILASVKEAEQESQKVVPLFSGIATPADAVENARSRARSQHGPQSRAARALSWAGNWAMRPQTAMAAVFLLMIGTSAFVIRSRHSSERAASVSVTEQGEPAAAAPGGPDEHDSLDSKAAAAAHGPNQPAPITAPPAATVATGASQSPVASAGGALALGGPADPNANAGFVDGLTAGKGRGNAKEDTTAFGSALSASAGDNKNDKDKEEGQARAEKKTATRAAASPPPPPSDISNAAAPAGAPYAGGGAAADYAPRSQTVAPPYAKSPASDPQDGFSAGMAAYRSRNFAEATRQFDGASRSGDQNAALWAAKSVKDGNGGCGVALPRFDAIAQKSSGSWIGNEATLESARCQIAMGQLDAARDKLAKLTSVPSHAAPAQQALNELNQVATKREAERAKAASGAGYARPAAAAPARAPAKPAATAGKPADEANKANGF